MVEKPIFLFEIPHKCGYYILQCRFSTWIQTKATKVFGEGKTYIKFPENVVNKCYIFCM